MRINIEKEEKEIRRLCVVKIDAEAEPSEQ